MLVKPCSGAILATLACHLDRLHALQASTHQEPILKGGVALVRGTLLLQQVACASVHGMQKLDDSGNRHHHSVQQCSCLRGSWAEGGAKRAG